MKPIISFFVSKSMRDDEIILSAPSKLEDAAAEFAYAAVPAGVQKFFYDKEEDYSGLKPKRHSSAPIPEDSILYL